MVSLQVTHCQTHRRSILSGFSFLPRCSRSSTKSSVSLSSWETGVTTGSLWSIFASRARGASSTRVSLWWEEINVKLAKTEMVILLILAPDLIFFVIYQTLTLGPGGPTLPAAPGKPVAPFTEQSKGGKTG